MAIIGTIIQVSLLIVNAIAILNEERFLAKSELLCKCNLSWTNYFKLDGFRRHARFVILTLAFNNHTTKLPMVLFLGEILALKRGWSILLALSAL